MRPQPSSALSGAYCLCVAVKRQVIIYEITRLKSRHKRLREVLLPAQAQSLDVFSEGRLCVGYQSGFTIYSLLGDQHPLCKLFVILTLHFYIGEKNMNIGLDFSPKPALSILTMRFFCFDIHALLLSTLLN